MYFVVFIIIELLKGTPSDVLEVCIKSSNLWPLFQKISLTDNVRSSGSFNHNQWLLKVGSFTLEPILGLPSNMINIPSGMVTNEDLIDLIYGQIDTMSIDELAMKVILTPTNKNTLDINKRIIQKLPGNEVHFNSVDTIISEDSNDTLNFPMEFLNSLTPSGMPPHLLSLKEGTIVMLIRNLNPLKGLCNGSRLIIQSIHRNFIVCKPLSNERVDSVCIPRIDLLSSDHNLPFTLKRRQLPVIPAFSMTINKSQGQSFDSVGIHLESPVFAHGQLYVALSRCRNPNNIKIFIENSETQGTLLNDSRVYTPNIVLTEVFD